jgi:hypothetical protein
MLAIAILFCFSCQKEEKNFNQLVPENTKLLLEFNSFDSIADVLQPILGGKSALLKAFIGFDPLNKEDLKEFGIHPDKQFGLFFSEFDLSTLSTTGKPDFTIAVAIPIVSGVSLVSNIESIIAKKSPDFKFDKKDGVYKLPFPTPETTVLMKEISGYLFIAAGKEEKPKDLLLSIGKSSINDSAIYRKISAELPSDSSISFYGNFQDGKLFSNLFNQVEKLQKYQKGPKFDMKTWFKGYKGFKVSIDLNSPDLKIDSAAFFSKDAPINELQKSISYDKAPLFSINKNPALILSFGLNFSKYIDMLFNSMTDNKISTQVNQKFDKIKEAYGIDLHNNILNNLGGNVNLGIYDLSTLKTLKFNGLLSISLKDTKKIIESLDILKGFAVKSEKFNLTVETIEDVQTFVITTGPVKIYMGVKNSLIISSDLDVYKQALGGDVNSGFLPKMKDSSLQKTFKNSDFFYLDFSQLLTGLQSASVLGTKDSSNPFLANLDKIIKIVEDFEYILLSNQIKQEIKTSSLLIKTKFNESFIAGLTRTTKKIAELKKETKTVK